MSDMLKELEQAIWDTGKLYTKFEENGYRIICGRTCDFYLTVKEVGGKLYAEKSRDDIKEMSIEEIVSYCLNQLPSSTEMTMYLAGKTLYYNYFKELEWKGISPVTICLTDKRFEILFNGVYFLEADEPVDYMGINEDGKIIISKKNTAEEIRDLAGQEIGYIKSEVK